MKTKSGMLIVITILAVFLGTLSGCSENSNGTEVVTSTTASTNSNDVTMALVDNEISIMKVDGVDAASGKGVFSLGWRQLFNPKDQTTTLSGRALAVGFNGGSTTIRGGIDMGSVYLNYSTNHLELQKHSGPNGSGIAYTSFSGHRGGDETNTNIPFVANGSYEFEVTGSTSFSAIKTTITAPAALLGISTPTKDQSIKTSNDLAITWQGGNTNSGVLIVIAAPPDRPAGGPPQDGDEHTGPGGMRPPGDPNGGNGGKMGAPPGGDHPPMPDSSRAIIVRLDNNSGTYTVNASALQELVKKTSAKELMCTVSQLTTQDVDHDGGKIHVILQNGDDVRVTLQ